MVTEGSRNVIMKRVREMLNTRLSGKDVGLYCTVWDYNQKVMKNWKVVDFDKLFMKGRR